MLRRCMYYSEAASWGVGEVILNELHVADLLCNMPCPWLRICDQDSKLFIDSTHDIVIFMRARSSNEYMVQ